MSRPITLGWVLLLFCVACLPLSLSVKTVNFDDDERTYYVPSIARMSAHWPAIDLVGDSTSATSPGYAYFLAGASRVTGQNLRIFRFMTIGISAATLWLLCMMFRAPHGLAGCVAILPLATSNFFIKSAAWVVTDNAALFWMCASLLALWKCPENPKWELPAGVSAACAIFVRQLHAWLIVPIGCVGLLTAGPGRPARGASSRFLAWSALVPPLALLFWLHHAWGGFVPPEWRAMHAAGIHPASVACALSVFAVFGIFYFLSVDSLSGVIRLGRSREAAVGAAAGFLIAVMARNGIDRAQGRWGGYFWLSVGRAPTLWGRSVLVVACSILGGALLGAMARRLRNSSGPALTVLWLASVSSWLVACGLNRLAFQRYFEPPILVFLISWLALLSHSQGESDPERVRYRPLVLLAALQACVSVVTTFIPVLAA